jgi:hypothetical protein
MDPIVREALDQVELAEAEVAVIRQEQVLRELLSSGEPTAAATALLQKLRATASRLAAQRGKPRGATQAA